MHAKSITYWINTLNLEAHPEGGYFRESYRDNEMESFSGVGDRNRSTAIYFLLTSDAFSAFHRIKADEAWHFYDGDPLHVHWIDDVGNLHTEKLGMHPDKGYFPQLVIPKHCWFASEVAPGGSYSLVGCTVAPGFDFADFELAKSDDLIRAYPDYTGIINRLTRN